MKPGSLGRDYKALETPQGIYPYGKNGVRNANTDSRQNEKGFRVSAAVLPYQFNGVIETDKDPIIFSTDNTYSAIGFYDEETDTYTPIVDDQNESYKLGFKLTHYIIGEARRNAKNHIEIAWLDKLNPVRFMDTEEPPTNLTNYLIFPEYVAPTVQLGIINGGTVGMGSYYAAVKYVNPDGTETRYSTPSTPIFAVGQNFAGIPGVSTGKAIKISITNIDTRYTNIQVVIIKRVKGITTAVELPAQPAKGSLELLYTGVEGEDISLEEVLIPAAFYNNAGSITQLNDILYLADMKEAGVTNLQKYANLVRVKWKSQYRSDIESDELVKSGELRTFKHGEAYAFYGVYIFANGQKTDGFHIPGIVPSMDSLTIDPTATSEGFSAKKYQTNTLGLTEINTADQTGRTGIWVNTNELYPTTDDFNSSSIGGADLRGLPVRHHKMPTLNQTKTLFYSSVTGFGVDGLDVLGVSVDNIIIPPALQGDIVGFELHYAKRDYSNATILSQGVVINGAKSGYTAKDVYFTGGNFHSRMLRSDKSHTDLSRRFTLTPGVFKMHHADLMVNRPAVTPSFLASNYRLKATIGAPGTVLNDKDELNFTIDYPKVGSVLSSVYTIKGIKDTGYILNNSSKGVVKNIKSEDGYIGTFNNNTGFTIAADEALHQGHQTEGTSMTPAYEETHLVDIVVVKADMYRTFNTRDLVRTGVEIDMDITTPKVYAFSGDCFLTIHSYWGYGVVDSPDRYPSNPGRVDGIGAKEEDTYVDSFYLGTSGTKVARRYVTESVMNLWQRYIDLTLPESEFYPAVSASEMNGMDRNKDNNTISISKDASSIGDLLNGIKTYDFEQLNIEQSPYKVVRSSKQSREGKYNSWKNYNALDYYEADKNMGPIINLQGMDDKLIIHHRNCIYITRDKTTLEGDILSVTLGTGDIFRIPPQQGKPSKTGYGGTQHQLACKLTDFGYIFPDAERGSWFVLNGEGLSEMNKDMYNFFQEYLDIPEINPFIGNGICVGYDDAYKRILITVKNEELINGSKYIPNYEETPEFFAKLIAGESIVFKDGRYQRYLGNNTSEFSCPVITGPVLGNYAFTIPEDKEPGFFVGQIAATGNRPFMYTIMSGNTASAFGIDPATGKIAVTNQAQQKVSLQTTFTLTVQATDINGMTDTGTVTITLTAVAKPPVTQDYIFYVDENVPINTLLGTIAATDPKGLTLSWAVQSQSISSAVKVDSNDGELKVDTAAAFDFETNPIMTAVIRVSNGGLYADSDVTIILRNINETPPSVENSVITILDTHEGNVLVWNQPTDPNFDDDELVTTLVSETTPEAFLLNFESRQVSVNSEIPLSVANSPYIITLKAKNPDNLEANFTVTINVIQDPTTTTTSTTSTSTSTTSTTTTTTTTTTEAPTTTTTTEEPTTTTTTTTEAPTTTTTLEPTTTTTLEPTTTTTEPTTTTTTTTTTEAPTTTTTEEPTTTTTTTAGPTTTTEPPIVCGSPSSYDGGISYPTTETVGLGSDTGTVLLEFNAISVPDRYIVNWDNGVVIDTGYRGDAIYDFGGSNRTDFTTALNGKVDPVLGVMYPNLANFPDDGYPRIVGVGLGSASFNKSLAAPATATIRVYAPMAGTAWSYTMYCPGAGPTTTTTTTTTSTTTTTTTTEAPGAAVPLIVRYNNNADSPCSGGLDTVYVQEPATDIAPGVIVYSDSAMTVLLTGQNVITSTAGVVYVIDIETGVVGGPTGQGACSM